MAVVSPFFEEVDLNDRPALEEIFGRYSIETVFHFAGSIFVSESQRNPSEYYHNNVVNTLNLLDCMKKFGVENLVFSSSCAVYGPPQYSPIDEDHPQHPISVYGRTKLMVENISDDYSRAYGLRYAVLRYFNAAGASFDGRLGRKNSFPFHVIPRLLQTTLGKFTHFEIFGDDYETPDGTCIRDYIHVEDLARAHCLALEQLRSGTSNFRVNLGTERGISVGELVSLCESITGKKIPVKISSRRSGDPAVLIADSSQAKALLGWTAENSSPERIIQSAWNWEQNRLY